MAAQTPQQGEGGTKSSRMTGASCYTPPAGTQLQRSQHSVHRDAANAATEDMTLDAQLRIVCKTGISKNQKPRDIVSKCHYIEVYGPQLMI